MRKEEDGPPACQNTRSQQQSPAIGSIRTSNGKMANSPEAIIHELASFYEDLYRSREAYSDENLDTYMSNIDLPSLSAEAKKLLDAPIALEEFQLAAGSFPTCKAPGEDGLPMEGYTQFGEQILPELLKVFNACLDEGKLPDSMTRANVILLLKSGKDPVDPGSYRPISLLQSDIKILAKVLALRVNRIVLSIIHQDQAGFMPQKSTATNLRKLFINMQLQVDNGGHRALLSLDANKAFDSISWRYLWAVMENLDSGTGLLHGLSCYMPLHRRQ